MMRVNGARVSYACAQRIAGGVQGAKGSFLVSEGHAQVEGSGELLREILVVLLFLGVEANVLEEKGLAVLEVVDSLGGLIADAVLGDLHLLAEELRQALGAGAERVLVLRTTLGAAEVGGDPNAGTVVEKVLDGRDGSANSRVIGDGLAIQGYIQIAADEHLQRGN